ncbi:hypothetical protein [Kitasatospora cinereorecta]|uniref:Uncharacterized protein n=1 Tax=Kitasatospora cinereorecta TaxID=285560 RepID=A0ABW0VQ43_9ACTN
MAEHRDTTAADGDGGSHPLPTAPPLRPSWLDLPEVERQLGCDLLDGHLQDAERQWSSVETSWQCADTLYTHIHCGEFSHLLAIRSSGHVDVLAAFLPTDQVHAVWRMLTCDETPREPLAQLAWENLAAFDLALRPALRELDAIERVRYEDGLAFVDFARAGGILTPTEAERLVDGRAPDAVRLAPYERESAAERLDLLCRWAAEVDFGGLVARLRPAAGRPAAGHDREPDLLEQWWDPPPRKEPAGQDTVEHTCTPRCAALDWRGYRPHANRSDAELHEQLRAARRAVTRATALQVSVDHLDGDALVREAVGARGPAATGLRRRSRLLAEAAVLMACAAADVQEARRRALAEREADAAAARMEQGWQRAAGHRARARARAPWSPDPEGDLGLLAEELPRLLENAVADDLLAVPDRVHRLEQEAAAWQSLATWCGWWEHGLETELAIRHHTGARPAPPEPVPAVLTGDAVLDLYRWSELRPASTDTP